MPKSTLNNAPLGKIHPTLHNQADYLLYGIDGKPNSGKKSLRNDPRHAEDHSCEASRPAPRVGSRPLRPAQPNASPSSLDNRDYLHISEKNSSKYERNEQLAKSMESVGWSTGAQKVRRCHRCFKAYVPACRLADPSNRFNVVQPTDSCDNRLCAFCTKKRSEKARRKLRQIFPFIKSPKLVTLTVKNVLTLDKAVYRWLIECLAKLRRRLFFVQACSGGISSIETTFNEKDSSWHPHIHLLIDSGFIPQKQLADAWEKITRGAGCIVDIREADENSIDEVVKYITKGADFIGKPERVKEFLQATERVRLVSTFGKFYGFDWEKQEVEFPPCLDCGCTDKAHYFLTNNHVSYLSVREVRCSSGEHYLTSDST